MDIQKVINDKNASLEQLAAAKTQVDVRLAELNTQLAAAEQKAAAGSVALAARSGTAEEAQELLKEGQGVELLINGVKSLQATLNARITAKKEQLHKEQLAARLAQAKQKLAERHAKIDEAEGYLSKAAESFKDALRLTREANRIGGDCTGQQLETIVDGLNLIPAATQRFWGQIGFKHPAVGVIDKYSESPHPIADIFEYESHQILPRAQS